MPDWDLEANELFLQVLEITEPEKRRRFLDEACGTNLVRRSRVDGLLRASEQAGSFLGRPAAGLETIGANMSATTPSVGLGTVVGHYKLVEEIGAGGMGTVYLAQQQEPMRRLVAIKVVKAGMDSKQVLARFEAERQALALMDHPNIAKVFDAGATADGRPYFVMELVKGDPITRYCDEKRLTPQERLGLFTDVCRAVQHAHQKGVIHRDLKPSNVLVAPYDGKPVVKVIDFGVAKAANQQLTERTLVTGLGGIIGTPEYMSPEQAELNNADIDTRSDVYSLGVLAYELLTGTTPLTSQRMKKAALLEVLRAVREEEPLRPSTRLLESKESLLAISARRQTEPAKLTRLVRGELDWIVMKALEKDRGRRYQTANGLAADVQRYLAGDPVLAFPPSAAYRFRKLVCRHKLLFSSTLVVVATLLVAVACVSWKWLEAEDARQQEEKATGIAQSARVRAEKAETDARNSERKARLREAEALVGQARGTRLSRRPGQRFEALAALKKAVAIGHELQQPPQFFDRLRNEAIAALALPDMQIRREFGCIPLGRGSVQLSDDFELYLQTSAKGDCTVRRMADDQEVARLPNPGAPALGGFGRGRVLGVLASEQFQMWELTGGKATRRFKVEKVNTWTFHPNGRLLALAHLDGSISVYEVATGIRAYLLPEKEEIHTVLQFHPTEPLIAVFSYHSRVVLVRDLRNGEVVASATSAWLGGNSYGAWSPDGRILLVPQGDGNRIQEYAFDLATPALRPTRIIDGGPFQGGSSITFSPAGDRFVCRGWSGTVHLFDAISGQLLFATHGLTPLVDLPPCYLQFDRTGTWLAGALVGDENSRFGLWSVADGREYRYLVHSRPGETRKGPAIHPDNRLAAIGHTDGTVLFDLETGRELAYLPLQGSSCARFDGVGNLLTNGFSGFFRWHVKPDPAAPGGLLIGPPERLPFRGGNYPVSASRDGHVIAQAIFGTGSSGGWILHPDSPTLRQLDGGTSMNWTCVSPDGRWVAFACHNGPVNVVDAATGTRAWQSPADQSAWYCCFSSDGRWLLTNGGRTYHANTWEPGPRLGSGCPWDAIANMAVLNQSGTYRLVELTTGRELAQLEDPDQLNAQAAFSPDGSKLVIDAGNGLRVWDLRRIRAGLVELGLDWDATPYPEERSAGPRSTLKVTIDRGDLDVHLSASRVADELRRKGDLVGALAIFEKLYAVAPGESWSNSYLAWMLAVCPDPKHRDAQRAVRLAQKAVDVAPHTWEHSRTLGVAQHFTGDDAAAVKSLTKSLTMHTHLDANDYFPLAAAYMKTGNPAEARKWFSIRGAAWMAGNKHPYEAELNLLRADAERVLGIENAAPAKNRANRPQ